MFELRLPHAGWEPHALRLRRTTGGWDVSHSDVPGNGLSLTAATYDYADQKIATWLEDIILPCGLSSLLHYVWMLLDEGSISDAEAQEALEQLAVWIAVINASKPSTGVWERR